MANPSVFRSLNVIQRTTTEPSAWRTAANRDNVTAPGGSTSVVGVTVAVAVAVGV